MNDKRATSAERGVWSKTPPKGWPFNTVTWIPQSMDKFIEWLVWRKNSNKDRGGK